jgi:glycerol-3-phosphate acyltransferase PlsX
MGAIFSEHVLGVANPRIGLLNVGEEVEKGDERARETHAKLAAADLNFVGNVEAHDMIAHRADVVVCDGFVGNVLLKFYEAIAPMMIETLRNAGVDGAQLEAGLKHLDYSEHGGAPLLGVKGVTIICHGSSSGSAFKNAIRIATQAVAHNLSAHIGAHFARREAESRG